MKTLKTWLITIAVLLCSISASGHDFEVDGIYYNIISATNLTVEVTCRGERYDNFPNEYIGDVVIPSTITYKSKTLTIIQIESDAFKNCTELTGIVIPNSVISIGHSAFEGCHALENLYFLDGAKTLHLGYNYSGEFYGTVGEGLFYNCPLKTLYLGRNLSYNTDATLGYSPFYNKRSLETVIIGDSVTNIKYNAFKDCTGIKRVHVNDLFTWCNIDFYSQPLAFGGNLYLNGNLLTNLIIPEDISSIKNLTFSGCTSITSITIPNSITDIGADAFRGCTNITSVTIPNSVESIGTYAFSGCTRLTSITIPNSVTSIGNNAFRDCN